jgi:glycosyltransferase involved in cell wall biosynthesis
MSWRYPLPVKPECRVPQTDPDSFRPCLVLPTYNNAGTLEDIVRRSLTLSIPTFVVNDGSTDDTAQVLESLEAQPLLHVLSHAENQGKAAAMLTGFRAAAGAGCTHAATVDTDGQLDPEQVPALLTASSAHPAALVLGVRDSKIARCPARSVIGRRLANALIRVQCGVRVIDSQCGLRVYPLAFITRVPVQADRFGFETEVITRAGWTGTPVVQVPVSCRYFEKHLSHFRPWVDTCRAIRLHARLLVVRARTPALGTQASAGREVPTSSLEAAPVRAAK